jgi:NodT family efflux transporter outer membrane factor (OMF) lipoprotein
LVATTTAERPLVVRETRQSMHRLGVLLGKEPGALTIELATPMPMPASPAVPSTLPSELLSRRPDLRRAERELAAAAARVGVARADLFPRFSLRGNFGRRSDDFGALGSLTGQFWSLVPGVRWPLLSGGRIRANIGVQDARQEQASREYEQAILIALQEVADALVTHAREQDRLTALQTARTANRRALDVSLDRYTGGLENFLSVLDAQRSVYESEGALVRSESSLALGVIAVYKSLGGGWTPDTVPTREPESSSGERGSR